MKSFSPHLKYLKNMNCRLEHLLHIFDSYSLKISSGKCNPIYKHFKKSLYIFGFQICHLPVMFTYKFCVTTSSNIFTFSLQISLGFQKFCTIYFREYFFLIPTLCITFIEVAIYLYLVGINNAVLCTMDR